MALKAVLDTLDGLDEAVAAEYTENATDKKFYLAVENVDALPAVKKVKDEAGARRIEVKTLKTKLEAFGDLDPLKTREQLDRIPELEAAAEGKLDEKKIDAIVEGRVKKVVAPIERERDALKTQVVEKDNVIVGFQTKEKTRAIHDSVRKAAAASKVVDTAQDDVLILAERLFDVDDQGTVVTKDNVGVTPGVTPDVWLAEVQDKKPHWWGTTAGGGASGSRGNTNSGPNPFTAENWNLTEQGALLKANPTKAAQMAKSAGTSVGGPKPAAKK